VREIARKDEDAETEAHFDPATGIVTVYGLLSGRICRYERLAASARVRKPSCIKRAFRDTAKGGDRDGTHDEDRTRGA